MELIFIFRQFKYNAVVRWNYEIYSVFIDDQIELLYKIRRTDLRNAFQVVSVNVFPVVGRNAGSSVQFHMGGISQRPVYL